MDRLYTPWRSAYVTGDKSQGCFLCDKARQDGDRENLVLHRGAHGYILLNTFPYNSAHLMVAPYAHVGDLPALDAATGAELWALTQRATAALQQEYRPEGFNIGMNLGRAGGAGMADHLHVHVVPRWVGDTNFMPLVGRTKVLPATLEQTYDRLRPYFAGSTP